MSKRPSYSRTSTDIKKGTVGSYAVGSSQLASIAARVTYKGSGKHKTYRSNNQEWEISPYADGSKCGKYAAKDWPKLRQLLKEAIEKGCVGGDSEHQFPDRVWAFVNDVLHEARLTNSGTGEYHAFPLDYQEHHPRDPEDRLKRAPRVKITVI